MSETFAGIRKEALELLRAGEANQAWTAFRPMVEQPVPAERWEVTWSTASALVAGLGATDLAAALQECVDPDAAGAHFQAAVSLYEESQYATATSLLIRALEVVPHHPKLLLELSACLEAQLRYVEAREHLRSSGLVGSNAWISYLFAFNALMSGQRDESREALSAIDPVGDDSLTFAVARLGEMHERAAALQAVSPLDDRDLDGWHAVINGTVLLHESEYGHDEPMRGRFAWIADSPSMIRGALDRLSSVLEAGRLAVPVVFMAPDRPSQIIATAAAKHFGVACEPMSAAGERPGLLVVYDLDKVGDGDMVSVVTAHRPGQVLWVHCGSWVNPFPLAPEFQTFLHQFCNDPWSGGAPVVDPGSEETRRSEPDLRPIVELADEILAAPPDSGLSPLRDVLAIERALAGVDLYRAEGRRRKQRAGSVVQSNRFT